MPEEINKETFDHLVKLAALDLDSAESEYLHKELNSQLNAIHELEAIPLSPDTDVTSHGVPYTPESTPPLRPDIWVPYDQPEEILSQVPQIEDGYVIVPDIPHTELE